MVQEALAEPQLSQEEITAEVEKQLEALIAQVSTELRSGLQPGVEVSDSEVRLDAMVLLEAVLDPGEGMEPDEDERYLLWRLSQLKQAEFGAPEAAAADADATGDAPTEARSH